MAFRLLLDEMTEGSLADYCEKLGHDVDRVVDVPELGSGADNADVVAYARRADRLLVTYDDDFLAEYDALDRIGVLFQAADRTSPFETANVIDAVSEHLEQPAVVESDEPVHLTANWL